VIFKISHLTGTYEKSKDKNSAIVESEKNVLHEVQGEVEGVLKDLNLNSNFCCVAINEELNTNNTQRFEHRLLKSPTGGSESGKKVMEQIKIAVIIICVLIGACIVFFLHYWLLRCITSKSVVKDEKKREKHYLKRYTDKIDFESSQFKYDQTE